MAAAAPASSTDRKKPSGQAPPDDAALAVALAAVKELPEPSPAMSERMAELRRLTVRTANQDTGRAAIEAAARLQAHDGIDQPRNRPQDHRDHCSVPGVVGGGACHRPDQIFHPRQRQRVPRCPELPQRTGNQQRRYILYAAGRCLHPGQFRPAHTGRGAQVSDLGRRPQRGPLLPLDHPRPAEAGWATVFKYSGPFLRCRCPTRRLQDPPAATRLAALSCTTKPSAWSHCPTSGAVSGRSRSSTPTSAPVCSR